MKKYNIKLRGKLLNSVKIIYAKNFVTNILSDKVIFKDEKNNNIAMFNQLDVEYITEETSRNNK